MSQTQSLDPISRLPAIIRGCRPAIARNALGAAVAILAVYAIGLAEGRADDAFEPRIPSGGIQCRRPAQAPVAVVAAANNRPFPVSLDEKLAGRVPVWRTIALGGSHRSGASGWGGV